ncbi:hypothetical protein KC315_g12950 [Hortaea werneckii]|nr:hypothetical protein KC315_g12950 [Hortaea werneckii]KAI7338826.1 hypothetical protein KC354_g17420 [Hortaea werneckii]
MRSPMTGETPILNEAVKIKRNLNQDSQDRWGFAIYRCTYDDDAAWDRFTDIITTRAQKETRELGEPEILDKLEWTILDDRQIFDNATTGFLRKHFNQWKSANLQREQPRATRSICTELYSLLDDTEMWRVIYTRPPEMAVV